MEGKQCVDCSFQILADEGKNNHEFIHDIPTPEARITDTNAINAHY
ncbi:hypothetical protein [Niallia sp. FSL W8-0635]|nr:hypothetical protein [Yersinia enterocolitica]